MGKTNNPDNKHKAESQVRISMPHLLTVLVGANVIMLGAPNFGMLNSFLYIPDIYTWSALILGIAMLVFGFRKLYQQHK